MRNFSLALILSSAALIGFAGGAMAQLPGAAPPPPPKIEAPRLRPPNESKIDVELSVGLGAAAPAGTRDFAGIAQALAAAESIWKGGKSARIRVAPGVYRETLDIEGSTDSGGEPLLVIEAIEKGTVVVSGGEEMTMWQADPDKPGRWTHIAYALYPVQPNPWPGLMPMDYPHFRHELLFWDDEPLFQAMDESELRPGAYLVDESNSRIILTPPAGGNPAQAKIEASVRPTIQQGAHSKLLRIYHRDNVVVRGLRFQYGMTQAFMGAVQILGSSNIVVEDCAMEWNSGGGLVVNPTSRRRAENILIRRTKVDNNGFIGISGGFHDGLLEDCETSGNNWRGARFGATGWAPCGFKLSGLNRVVVRNHQAHANYASGAWFDDHIANVLVEGLVSTRNLRSGISTEAVTGPMLIRNSVLVGNSVGWNLFDSSNVVVADSLIVDNHASQIRLAGSTPLSEAELAKYQQEWRRARLSKRHVPLNIGLIGSKVGVSSDGPTGARLISFGMRGSRFTLGDGSNPLHETVQTLGFGGNVYGHPGGGEAKVFPSLVNEAIDFEYWKFQVAPTDADALWEAEKFDAAAEALTAEHGKLQPVAADKPASGKSSADELEL